MAITIDLLNLNSSNKQLLIKLFAGNQNKNVWPVGNYWVDSQEIILSHKVIGHFNAREEKKVYEVLDHDLFAKGCFGSLYLSKVTLVPNQECNELIVKIKSEKKQRLVKIQELKYFPKEKAEKEVQNLQRFGFFHCKPLSSDQNQSFITMRKLPGVSLLKLIEQNQLGILDRYELTKALVMALKEQINDNNLIHRDVKPENILITGHFIIYIIDLALAILKDYDDRHDTLRGAVPYAAPESYSPFQCATSKTDIYALGRVLMMLWGDDYLHNRDFNPSDVLYTAKHVSFSTLYDRMDEIPVCHSEIQSLLASMVHAKAHCRPDLEQIMRVLDSLSDKLQPIPNPAKLIENSTCSNNFNEDEKDVPDDFQKGKYDHSMSEFEDEGFNAYYGF